MSLFVTKYLDFNHLKVSERKSLVVADPLSTLIYSADDKSEVINKNIMLKKSYS